MCALPRPQDAAATVSAQEIISQEVMTFLSALHVRPSNGAKLKVGAVKTRQHQQLPVGRELPSARRRRRAARQGTRITLWTVDRSLPAKRLRPGLMCTPTNHLVLHSACLSIHSATLARRQGASRAWPGPGTTTPMPSDPCLSLTLRLLSLHVGVHDRTRRCLCCPTGYAANSSAGLLREWLAEGWAV